MPPFDGNGIYELPVTTVTPAVAGTTIDDSEFNTFTGDLATALTLCVAKDGQTPSPVLTDPKILTKILDTDSNELLEFGTTGSAVNHIKVINAATGNVPTIQTAGEVDTGLDIENSEGEELLKIGATATAVNEVTITNSAAGDAVSIAATGDDTNIDLQLAGKGTGSVSIGGINTKIVDIGDWDMDTTASINVAHGLTLSKIRAVSAMISNDAGTGFVVFLSYDATGTATDQKITLTATNVVLVRQTLGVFDSPLYSTTPFNRGWIVVDYID